MVNVYKQLEKSSIQFMERVENLEGKDKPNKENQ